VDGRWLVEGRIMGGGVYNPVKLELPGVDPTTLSLTH